MKRLLAIAVLLLAAKASAQPNIVFLSGDDFGSEKVQAYTPSVEAYTNNPGATPNFDAMAAAGIRFENFTTNSVCSVSRAAFLTGRDGYRTGVGGSLDGVDPTDRIGEGELTVAKLLKAAGYYTAAAGKWHLCDGPGESCDIVQHAYALGFKSARLLSGGGDAYNSEWLDNGVLTAETGMYEGAETADRIIEEINAGEADPPYFIWGGFHLPHSFITQQSCPPDDHTVLHNATCDAIGGETGLRQYAHSSMEALDYLVDRVIDQVDLNDTCVIFVGDNGTLGSILGLPYSGSHGKATVYLQGNRVPLIAIGACVAPSEVGTVGSQMIQAADVAATFLDIAGLRDEVASGRADVKDGISFKPYLVESSTPSIRTVSRAYFFLPNGLPYNPIQTNLRVAETDLYRLLKMTDGVYEMYNSAKATSTDKLELTPLFTPSATPNISGLTAQQQAAYNLMKPFVDQPGNFIEHPSAFRYVDVP